MTTKPKTNNTTPNTTPNTTSKLDRDTNPLSLKKLKPHKKALIIVAILLVLDLTVTGFLKFGYTVVRCGGVPVKVTHYAFGWGEIRYTTPQATTLLAAQLQSTIVLKLKLSRAELTEISTSSLSVVDACALRCYNNQIWKERYLEK